MSSLLPLFLSPQNGLSVLGGDGLATGRLGEVSTGQPTHPQETFAQAFSQVLHEQGGDTPAFLKQWQTLLSTHRPQYENLPNSFLRHEVRHLQSLVDPDILGNLIQKAQVYQAQESPHELLPLAAESDLLLDFAKRFSPSTPTTPLVVPNEPAPYENLGISFEQIPLPDIVPTIPFSPLQGIQPQTGIGLPRHAFQQSGGNPVVGEVRPELEIDGSPIRNVLNSFSKILDPGTAKPIQGSLPKETESAFLPQQTSQGATGKQASSGLKVEEGVPTALPSPKGVPGGLQQVGRVVGDEEISRSQIFQRPQSPLLRSHTVPAISIPPATSRQAEGPAGFAGPGQPHRLTINAIQGNSLVLGEVSGSGTQHSTTVPIGVTGESVLAKGEHTQSISETSTKSLGVEPGSGQGLGSGMNHFSNSQSGFQQSHLSSGQGVGLRAMEERGVEFPAQVLQRLQMDVQLSDNQRVMIDVGVQNKQVYAGLVMDHSILRSLANQFVPQLEHQLSQVDLDLQEFSAEVREERDHESDAWFGDSRSHEGPQSGRRAQDERISTQNSVNRQLERGLHLLA
ncbi:MAG: hypothetical protein WD032_07465 [Nitrospirales bacterium]